MDAFWRKTWDEPGSSEPKDEGHFATEMQRNSFIDTKSGFLCVTNTHSEQRKGSEPTGETV